MGGLGECMITCLRLWGYRYAWKGKRGFGVTEQHCVKRSSGSILGVFIWDYIFYRNSMDYMGWTTCLDAKDLQQRKQSFTHDCILVGEVSSPRYAML